MLPRRVCQYSGAVNIQCLARHEAEPSAPYSAQLSIGKPEESGVVPENVLIRENRTVGWPAVRFFIRVHHRKEAGDGCLYKFCQGI